MAPEGQRDEKVRKVNAYANTRQSTGQGEVRNAVMELSIAGGGHDYHVALGLSMQGEYEGSLLSVLHDFTEFKQARDKHKGLLEGIITTLVRVTDMHDPHCANHSGRTRDVVFANAFVGMCSSGAYRPRQPIDQLIDNLLEQADGTFDRNVIAALFHFAPNRSDWKNWQTVQVSDQTCP